MDLDQATRDRLAELIASDRVVLFMKGDRDAPQCGFSATVCGILDHLLPDYHTVDVLSEPEIRDGIKAFSSWPTIPQLYVDGDFVGGCDIVQEMFDRGRALRQTRRRGPGCEGAGHHDHRSRRRGAGAPRRGSRGRDLHLSVDARFETRSSSAPPPGDLRVESNGVVLFVDPLTARRADGVTIDAVDTPDGPGFQIDNPNAGPRFGKSASRS